MPGSHDKQWHRYKTLKWAWCISFLGFLRVLAIAGIIATEVFSEADSGYRRQRICCALVPQLGLSEPSIFLLHGLVPAAASPPSATGTGTVDEELCSLRSTKVFESAGPHRY